jgi:hypothetical protein
MIARFRRAEDKRCSFQEVFSSRLRCGRCSVFARTEVLAPVHCCTKCGHTFPETRNQWSVILITTYSQMISRCLKLFGYTSLLWFNERVIMFGKCRQGNARGRKTLRRYSLLLIQTSTSTCKNINSYLSLQTCVQEITPGRRSSVNVHFHVNFEDDDALWAAN